MAVYQVSPTIDTNAYADGDIVGGANVLKGAANRNGRIIDVTVWDADGEKKRLDFFFFTGALTGTYTDNEAFAVHASDASKLFGVISIATTDYFDAGADAIASKAATLAIRPNGVGDIYVVAVCRAAITYTATTDLRFEFGVIWD